MPISNVITSQSGGRRFDVPDFTKYSYFEGGVNATHHALRNYSPQINGFGRLFMVRSPFAILRMFASRDSEMYDANNSFIQFKHMTEYMNRSVEGFTDKVLENAARIEGGNANRGFNLPTSTRETTTSITISLYEFTGSPVREVIDGWMNAIADENSGLATYGGLISGGKNALGKDTRLFTTDAGDTFGIPFNEANHTCEFIWVAYDRSGSQVEYAVLLADCYPTSLPQNILLNKSAGGAHDVVIYDIPFNCVVYRSNIITSIANDLLKQYRIVSNSLNFNPQLGDAIYSNDGRKFNRAKLGGIPTDSATGTLAGNVPIYNVDNATMSANDTITVAPVPVGPDMRDVKLAGNRNATNTVINPMDRNFDFSAPNTTIEGGWWNATAPPAATPDE